MRNIYWFLYFVCCMVRAHYDWRWLFAGPFDRFNEWLYIKYWEYDV